MSIAIQQTRGSRLQRVGERGRGRARKKMRRKERDRRTKIKEMRAKAGLRVTGRDRWDRRLLGGFVQR